MVVCPHCGKETPDKQNYCVWCGGALRFSARFRGLWAKTKTVPKRVKTKALAWVGGGPKVKEEAAPEGGAEAPAEGGGKKSVAGITGWRTPGTPMMKQAGRYGIWIGLALLVVFILFSLMMFVGGLFLALPLFWMIIIIGGLLFVVLLFKGRVGVAIVVLLIFGGLGWGAWYLQYTPYGQDLTLQFQVQGVGAVQSFRALSGPLNVMGQIFQGTYNPENLWRSDQVQSQYETVTDVGVTLSDVKPIREKFSTSQPLVVQGKINAVAFPGQNITPLLRAECREEPSVPGSKRCSDPTGWDCQPKFKNIKEIRNRIFSCNHTASEETGVFPVEITATAQNTVTVAGKQFVFANPDVALTLENPLQTWGISAESLKSWQKGDEALNLGIGVVGEPDYLEAGSNLDYYIGVSIDNPASHTGTANIADDGVHLFVPKALFNNNCNTAGGADSNFRTCTNAAAADLNSLGLKPSVELCDCIAGFASGQSLEPGAQHLTALLKIRIDKSQLYGADFGTFFTLATVKYNYVKFKQMAVTVEQI